MIQSIVLTGYRRVGKTETAKHISERTGLLSIDADAVFEGRYGGINNFQAKQGVVSFRTRETAVLEAICRQVESSGSPIVLATGGGAVAHDDAEQYRAKNVQLLKRLGLIFYLTPSLDVEESAQILSARVEADPVKRFAHTTAKSPLDEYRRMLNKRDRLYRETADAVIVTGRLPPGEVATLVTKRYCAMPTPTFSFV